MVKFPPPLLFVILIFCSLEPKADILVFWDVGQGQWTTWIQKQECHHFDMGGELFPKPVFHRCRFKKNFLNISHFDWDHISFISDSLRKGLHLCLSSSPDLRKLKYRSLRKKIAILKLCNSPSQKVQPERSSPLKNNQSIVYFIKDLIALTGDAPKSVEEKISQKRLNNIRILGVGHHGSATSTSPLFLGRMPRLKLAVVSARKSKYGHPHVRTLATLKKFKIPVLRTEDWGSIVVEF
ncbi:MAG TPA: hydrolase [Bdellovibrionales bacterium]|nr:hydrolase [Pseudobdellovibrionaceae bacterium]HAG92248.1 hydrolase [Bdellovibrionales bacterium]